MTTMGTEELLRLTVAALMSRTGERQGDLAEAIGQAQAQVSRKQSGRAHWSLDDVDRLAAHWGMPVLDLLAGPTHAASKLPADRLMAQGTQTLIPTADPVPAAASTSRKKRPKAAKPVPAAPAPEREPQPAAVSEATPEVLELDRDESGSLIHAAAEPCVLCGAPAPTRAGGRPQHVFGLCLTSNAAPVAAPNVDQEPQPARSAVPAGAPRRTPGHSAGSIASAIAERVQNALRESAGDFDAAQAALVKRAIPDVMEFFQQSRVGGRYEHSEFPPTDDILKKKSQKGADKIWEARPKWTNPKLSEIAADIASGLTVRVLDMNAAYLSAMKAWLPIGRLVEDTSGEHNTKKSGVHLIAPWEWPHDHLPNPLGDRREEGEVWIGEETLRNLIECADLGLAEPPVILRSLVSGGTESLLGKLRQSLADVRKMAIAEGDELTTEYVKSMYSKFVSTIGESTSNRALRRPDWMHIIRGKAHANLWRKAYRAHRAGLTVAQISGTDELHVIGDWRVATIEGKNGRVTSAFPEGRNLNEVKEKKTYTIGGK